MHASAELLAVNAPPAPTGPDRSATVQAVLVGAGAFVIVLAGMRSAVFDLDRHAVPKELTLHVVALGMLLLVVRQWRSLRAGVIEALLGAFVLWSALSALFATNHWIALRALGLTGSAFVLFITVRRLAGTALAGSVLGALAAAATLAAAIGAAQAYGLELDWLASERAPGGTFGNRNFLAHLVTIAVPAVILCALRARHSGFTIGWAVALGVCLNAIVLTRSRAAWLGLVAAILCMAGAWLIGRRTLREAAHVKRVRWLAGLAAFGGLTAVALPNRLEWRSDSPYAQTLTRIGDYRSGSGRGRVIQYRNSLELVAMDPVFGTGPGNWFIKYPLVTSPPDPSFNAADPIPTNPWPSSDWMAVLAERGPIGLAIVLLTGAAILLTAMRRLRGMDSTAAVQAAIVLGVLAAVVITGLFDAVLLSATPVYFAAVALGLLLPRTQPVIDRPLRLRARRAAIYGTLGFVLLVSAYSLVQFLAIRVTRESTTRATLAQAARIDPTSHRLQVQLARRGNCEARLPHARAAARLMPHHDAPRRALTACGEAPAR